jgi:pimeloyl-ACP methyl ester carboxylesterase
MRALLLALLTGWFMSTAAAAQELKVSIVEGSGGVPLTVVQTGKEDGPPILFLHGYSQSYLSFIPQLRSALGRDFKLVAMDFRGMGGSGKPWTKEAYGDSKIWADDVAAVIKATGIEKPVVVAWSFAGYVVMDYLRHYPAATLGGVYFVGANGGIIKVPPPTTPPDPKMLKGSADRRSLSLEDNIAGAKNFAEMMTAGPASADANERSFVGVLTMPSYAMRAMAGRSLDNVDIAAKLTALPVVFAGGSKDFAISPALMEQIVKVVPNARYEAFQGAGHSPFVEQPDAFNAKLAAFVKTVRKD